VTGDAKPGAVVEMRAYEDSQGRKRSSLATRSDLTIEAQVTAPGATWIDRQLLAKEATFSGSGFGAAAREAMDRRLEHLAGEGLVRRQGQRVIFARDLLDTLRKRDLTAAAKLSTETGLAYRPPVEGEHVAGVYLPPAFFWWWYAYDAYAPPVFVEGAYIAASGGALSIAAAIGMSVWRAREAKIAATYGSARWATSSEVRVAGLVASDGVVLGRLDHNYLRHDGPEHVLCFAPTRSGKGVGLVVPTLLTWPGSCIVHDTKCYGSYRDPSKTRKANYHKHGSGL
jgi:hypothetical protein